MIERLTFVACILMPFHMQIFFPLLTNGYYFVECFNFLAKKVEIMHSVSHNNVENDVVLVGVSFLVIFLFLPFTFFCFPNHLIL